MSRLAYFFRETAISLRRNLLMTLAGIMTVAVSLFLFGGVLLASRMVDRGTERWRDGVELEVFMNVDATSGQEDDVREELVALQEQQIVDDFRFLTKQDAYDYFREVFGQQPELVENVTPEVLPTSFRIKPTQPEFTPDIVQRFEGRAGVRRVLSAGKAVDNMLTVTRWIRWSFFALAAVLLASSLFLIVNTIRLATFARRREIEVMKLVGASNWFVRIPFMAEGLVQGAVGAGLAFGLVYGLKELLVRVVKDTDNLFKGFFVTTSDAFGIGVLVLAIGAGIGLLGALVGLRRFLEV
jgi:cell division transport system permease protein